MKKYLPFLLLFLLGGGAVVYYKSRGLRNRNPGNIEKSNDKWQGLSAVQTDERFFQFTEMKWGLRALMRLLTNYFYKYNLSTVRGIIDRYAPDKENPTSEYQQYVASKLGVSIDTPLVIEDVRVEMAKAIVAFENGFNPIPDSTYYEAEALI